MIRKLYVLFLKILFFRGDSCWIRNYKWFEGSYRGEGRRFEIYYVVEKFYKFMFFVLVMLFCGFIVCGIFEYVLEFIVNMYTNIK